MDYLNEFNKVMETTGTIALASSVNNDPNVRIVAFYYDPQSNGVIYFPTYKESPKTEEFAQNDKVAFTTIPNGNVGLVRVTNAIINKSTLTINDIKDGIIKKYPGFSASAEKAGHMMEVYEVKFTEASVNVGQGNVGKVTF